ncbi:ribonuclease HII [Albibacterium bauzanense]|uniref:Ribonuclease HII n=1 Tax=Albibacterium bauzanense TaxID=653929 RepID=A0A4R1LUP2_9SPHI|nr:ribonuclease HII [Albibacterium bauzanense]TCK83076.1 RNase HII [Albibacterium bauzanense]
MLYSAFQNKHIEAGCDEAGRGCLAGPVFAAAVIFPPDFKYVGIDDSKKLTSSQRYALRELIQKEAIAYAVGQVDAEEIDEINILNASFLAMHRALDLMAVSPGFLIIDGNRFKPYRSLPHECIVQGDGKYLSIAAASILAKTYRDDYMANLAIQYPQYDWQNNKGYATLKHRMAVTEHGLSPYHRKTFRTNALQLEIFS